MVRARVKVRLHSSKRCNLELGLGLGLGCTPASAGDAEFHSVREESVQKYASSAGYEKM